MRRCFTLLIGLIAFVTSSCDDKTKEEIADVIILSRDKIAFPMEGGSTAVSVASPSQWTADCVDGWVKLHPEDGSLTITTEVNVTNDNRDAKIIVKSAQDEHEILVHQAYSRNSVYLSLSASDEIKFDSEGESNIFTVVTNGTWEATSEATWLTIVRDQERSTVTVSAPKSEEAATRSAIMTITARVDDLTKSCDVAVSQISRSENPYFKLLGSYGLFAKNWYYDTKPLGVSGIGTFCTVEQNEYGKSVYIKDLFMKGTVVEATYKKEDGSLSIELGRSCLIQQFSDGSWRSIYLKKVNMSSGSFEGNTLNGILGTGKDEDGQVRKAILLGDFDSGYPALGLVARLSSGGYASYRDLYYATGEMYLIESDASAGKAVGQAAAAITPSSDGISAFNN